MPVTRPFRFASALNATATAAAYFDGVRRIEALGYATVLTGDHFTPSWFEPGPAMVVAALATSTLRVGCTVFGNDFRHPALLAKEAASIDVLTGGRFEFGIGAGWNKREYDQVGMPFDPPAVRVARIFLIGSIEQISEGVLARRERHGISYLSVYPRDMAAFAPVVAQLAGR